ncbi:peptidase [Abyssibius alkaniclasticus]|uniref:peptidase n=1 Tax=Abyssibius alkaniclasticus TaxID=2881234 RepID=UPI0023648D1C|nr:peptidase [Abyssibius alkaniclasticus]UPH71638.1 peptidase [Abyssibius alkaniclasticus]
MTYCVGLLLNAGMVLLADTRTNAGVDNIATYQKMFTFEEPGERVIVIMTAGSLSVSQNVIARLQEDIADPDVAPENCIMGTKSMLTVAQIIGDKLADVSHDINQRMARMSQAASASMLVAGQRKGGVARMFHIYPEGNFIEAAADTPYLQIGEHKYGKPLLDRVITPETSLEDGRKAVLLSMDSTLRSNLSVGMPLDLAIVRDGECKIASQERIEADDPAFRAMSEAWSKALRDSFSAI